MSAVYIPSDIAPAVRYIQPVVAHLFQQSVGAEPLELEARLGSVNNGKWQPGVGASFFHATVDMLRAYGDWVSIETDLDSHDYFYTAPNGKRVRTSIVFSGEYPVVTHIEKQALSARDVRVASQPHDVRVCVKREVPVPVHELPKLVAPDLVRIKKRTSFSLPLWRFDCTQVWTGASRGAAETAQSSGNATYELEVEFLGTQEDAMKATEDYLSASTLLKACSIFGCGVQAMTPA